MESAYAKKAKAQHVKPVPANIKCMTLSLSCITQGFGETFLYLFYFYFSMEKASLIKIKPSMPLSLFIVGTFSLLLICSFTVTSMVYAQIFPKSQTPSNTTKSIPKLHLVKITSPKKGQQVSVGKNLVISGTSLDNATSDCKVSIKVNGVKPFHDALPNGTGGQSDYSKWSFTLTPAYTTLTQGQNKISAKFACAANPGLISKNSVNVTGVTATAAAIP